MKKTLILPIFIVFLLFSSTNVFADEVGEDEEIWQQLSRQELKCSDLSQSQFESLGEFFMERMAGFPSVHETMDKRMEQMMGKERLGQMHLAMGKRMSGCDLNAVMPGMGGMMGSSTGSGLEMMMGLKGGGKSMMGPGMMGWYGGNGGTGWMMGGGQGGFWIWSILSWITWILVIVALIAFIRWMWKKGEK